MLAFPTAASARRRFPRLLVGLVVCGVGVAGMVRARLGLGPWDVFHQGLSDRTGVPIGTVGILVGFVVLLGWIPLRQRIGLGTVCNIVIIGLVIDGILAATTDPSASPSGWPSWWPAPSSSGWGAASTSAPGSGRGPATG